MSTTIPPVLHGTADAGLALQMELTRARDAEASLMRALAESRAEVGRLTAQLEQFAREHDRLESACVDADAKYAEVASLLAVSQRLMGSADRPGLLRALEEIAVDLLGCEEFIILETGDSGAHFEVARGHGTREQQLSLLGESSELLRAALATLRPASGTGPEQRGNVLCVPIVFEGRPMAALYVFSLLPHKHKLDAFDRQIAEVISAHGGVAFARTARIPEGGWT